MIISLASGTGSLAEPVRLATWNLGHLYETYPAKFERFRRDPDDFERLAFYASRLDADIVALQEIESAALAEKIFGPDYVFFFSSRNRKMRVGLAIRKSLGISEPPRELTDIALPYKRLRHALDLKLPIAGGHIRILVVHLKSFYHDKPLDSDNRHCRRLSQQLPILEDWIDARAREGVPFILLGDFNRRFDIEASNRDGATFWSLINDQDPPGQSLSRITQFRKSSCWGGTYPHYIDHIILGPETARKVVPGSFRQILYREEAVLKRKLSDHCPIAIDLALNRP